MLCIGLDGNYNLHGNCMSESPRVRPSMRPCSTATTEKHYVQQPKGVTEILIHVGHQPCAESPIFCTCASLREFEYPTLYRYYHTTNIGEAVTPPMPTTPKPINPQPDGNSAKGCEHASLVFIAINHLLHTPRPLERTSLTQLLSPFSTLCL